MSSQCYAFVIHPGKPNFRSVSCHNSESLVTHDSTCISSLASCSTAWSTFHCDSCPCFGYFSRNMFFFLGGNYGSGRDGRVQLAAPAFHTNKKLCLFLRCGYVYPILLFWRFCRWEAPNGRVLAWTCVQ